MVTVRIARKTLYKLRQPMVVDAMSRLIQTVSYPLAFMSIAGDKPMSLRLFWLA